MGTGNESDKYGCQVLHHAMHFLRFSRFSTGKIGSFHRPFVTMRRMEPRATSTTNEGSTRARKNAKLCINTGQDTGTNQNRSLERSRESKRLSLYSYIGTVFIFLRWLLGIFLLGPAQHVWRTFDRNTPPRNASKTSRVFVVDNASSCDKLLQSYLSKYPSKLNFLGLDCEWVNKKGQTNVPVALLQIATPLSDCFLIRLCKMDGHLPQTVREILEDKSILKFGVGIKDDAKRLTGMFGVNVLGCVDLRHVVQRCRVEYSVQTRYVVKLMHLSMLSCRREGGRLDIGKGFDSNCLPLVGTFDCFSGLSNKILLKL